MPPARRLTDQERHRITRDRAKGVSVRVLATRLGVSEKTVYNVLSHGRAARSANGSRTRVLTMRISEGDLRAFDDCLSRRRIAHRSEAMRRLLLAASGLLAPDDHLVDEMRGLGAALNRVGNNVNQIARRLNEARVRGEALPWTGTGPTEVRALAGLIFTLADQIQDLSRNRRERLKIEVDKALAPLIAEVRDGAG